MAASSSKAVLLITGGRHIPGHYRKVTEPLEKEGIRVLCPSLPTNNHPPDHSLQDDIQCIREIVHEEISKGTQLTVVAHSYGGAVATAALHDFAIDSDNGGGGGGVAAILYIAGYMLLEEQSVADVMAKAPPPPLQGTPQNKKPTAEVIIDMFYNDLPKEQAQEAYGKLVSQCNACLFTPLSKNTPAAWRRIPTSYLFCENDRTIAPSLQRMMISTVSAAGIAVKEFRCSSGHSPFLSQPEFVVDVIGQVFHGTSI